MAIRIDWPSLARITNPYLLSRQILNPQGLLPYLHCQISWPKFEPRVASAREMLVVRHSALERWPK